MDEWLEVERSQSGVRASAPASRLWSKPRQRPTDKKEAQEMKSKNTPATAIIVALLAVSGGLALAAQDRFALKEPNGVAFSDIRGYETWPAVAVSQVDGDGMDVMERGLKVIVANPTMIDAYKEGIPGNGKPFPDGSKIVKIEWSEKDNPESPYSVKVPDTLKRVGFIEKDSQQFPDTNGWGYAQFTYDPATGTFAPEETDPSFGKELCHACHVAVAAKDEGFPRLTLE
jgi:hypothetical protein